MDASDSFLLLLYIPEIVYSVSGILKQYIAKKQLLILKTNTMSTLKKCKIVMLPTNQQTKYLMVYSDVEKTKGKLILNGLKNDEYKEYQHLYIISDDEIKEGDYFLADNRLNTTSNKGLPNWVLCKCTKVKNSWVYCNEIPDEGHNGDWCKKIIATTDESLNLPQPSQQFIQKFVEEYNRGNIITDVLVEYELISNEEYFGNTINPDDDVPYFDENLKINPKDSTITIKKAKDSYTREEVVKLLVDCCGEVSCEDGKLLGKSPEELYKWIEENL